MDRNSRLIRLLAAVLMLLGAAFSLYAGGGRDVELSRADALIREKRYDEAIQVLTLLTQQDPNKFDQAQRRFRRIFQIREQYQHYADELLDTLAEDPENSEKILLLSRKMEELESPSSAAAGEFLRRTRDLALFSVNRERLERILREGRALIDRGDYAGAYTAYTGGLDIYREEFFAAAYGPELEGRVREAVETISGEGAAFTSLIRPLNSGLSSIEQLGQGEPPPPARFEERYGQLEPSLDRLSALRNSLAEIGDYFARQLTLLREKDPQIGDRSYLSFVSRLLYGRPGEEVSEGMIGAVDEFWDSYMARLDLAAADLADRSFAAALAAFEAGNYPAAEARLDQCAEYARFPLDLTGRWRSFYEKDGEFQTILGQPVPAQKAEYYLKYQALARSAAHLREGAAMGIRLRELAAEDSSSLGAWKTGILSVAAAEEREEPLRRGFDELFRRISALGDQTAAGIAEFTRLEAQFGGGEAESLNSLKRAQGAIQSLSAEMIAGLRDSALRQYGIAGGDLENRLRAREEELARGNAQIEGQRQSSAAGGTYSARYPAEALELLNLTTRSLEDDTRTAEALLARYDREPPELLAMAPINRLRDSARTTTQRLRELGERALALSSRARTLADQAESLRFDGDRLYREAQNAIARNDYETARERVLRAAERYNASLEIQESPSLRGDWDTRLLTLGAEIKRVENESVVREVRSLVNNARDTYFAGNFEEAEELLVRARNRWLVVNIEDDAEITYWLTVVRGAVSLRSGRVILVTAPLYAEMSQLLSDARRNYDEGVRYLNAERRTEGLAKLSEARKKTQEVKLMFPVNQEAGILELQIDQVMDPAAFNASFARRFNDAVAGTKPDRRSLEAFADLQNLAEINPRYPGIRSALVQAEIDMGYRLPPPDPQAQALAREIVQQARSVIDTNTRSQFPIILEQLNRALQLDPSNTQAMYEKDRVQTLLGSEGNVVLGSAAEQEYQRAVRELQQRNTLTAMAIVQQLLEDPKNRNSLRILELRRRIESAL